MLDPTWTIELRKNIENVPVDEVDTDEELKRWIREE